jgi:hypothetical protein
MRRKSPVIRQNAVFDGMAACGSSTSILANIFINLYWNAFAVESIRSILVATGDPILFSRFHIPIIRLKSSTLQAAKCLPAVVERCTCP